MKEIILLMSIIICLAFVPVNCQTTGVLIDSRNGEIYKTIKIGNQIWMAENLRLATDASFVQKFSSSYGIMEEIMASIDGDRYIKFNDIDFVYYKWETAKRACPIGWHLPSKEEFEILLGNFSDPQTSFQALLNGGSSGFNVKMRGSFANETNSNFWSSTYFGDDFSWACNLWQADRRAEMNRQPQDDGLCVRCIKDSNNQTSELKSNNQVEEQIIKLMGEEIEISERSPTRNQAVTFEYYDLNMDGVNEIVVWNRSMSGAQNCPFMIWQQNPLRKILQEDTWGVGDFKVLLTATSGYSDIEANYYVSGEAYDTKKAWANAPKMDPENNIYITFFNDRVRTDNNKDQNNLDQQNLNQKLNKNSEILVLSNINDPVELAKKYIEVTYNVWWNPVYYYTNIGVYSLGRITAMYGGGYILLESPMLAFDMAKGGFYDITTTLTKDFVLDIIKRAVRTPDILCKNISETLIIRGLSDYKLAYEIVRRYQNTKILTPADAKRFLRYRWGLSKLPIGRVLFNESNSQRSSLNHEFSEKIEKELIQDFELNYKKTHSMTNTLSVTETALLIKDIMDVMAQKNAGLMNYGPYLNFIKKIEQLDKFQIDEANRLKY